jgi:preprotein translocase subunit SecB
MEKAEFSIINYRFEKVTIDLSKYKKDDLSLSFKTKGLFIKKNSIFELTFLVDIFNQNEKENNFVSIQCKGDYKFENVSDINEIPDFFYRNSIAILFPYVRSYVSLVTTQANVPGIILPTLNLSNLEGELRKNTIEN